MLNFKSNLVLDYDTKVTISGLTIKAIWCCVTKITLVLKLISRPKKLVAIL